MTKTPIDLTKVHSAKQLYELQKAQHKEIAEQARASKEATLSLQKAMVQEQRISKLSMRLQSFEEKVEHAEQSINKDIKLAKGQQYRWEKRLEEITEETRDIAQWLDANVPSTYLPILNEAVTNGMQFGEDGRPVRQSMYWDEPVIREEIEKELLEQMDFRSVRQLVRRQDRLSAIQFQKVDILQKMDTYPERWENRQRELRDNLNAALEKREELSTQLSQMIGERERYRRENAGVELTQAIEKSNAGIANAQKITLSNDKLRLKNVNDKEVTRQAMVRVGALRREADYTVEQLIEYGRTREQGNLLPRGSNQQIYTMQFLEKADIVGNTIEVICDQVQKGKWVDNHAQMQIALRGGFRCPQRTGVRVLRHIRDSVYMVHFLQYDVVTDIALSVPSEPKIKGKVNNHYHKYKIATCLPWHPNWTSTFERSGKIVPADVCSNSKYGVNDALRFHRQLMDALPALPSIVPDIAMDVVGLPKDPTSATAIAFGD